MSATAPAKTLLLPTIPYRGIESFRYVDQAVFFAREEETKKLLRSVTLYRGVLFYGDSGAGKSSLINAGFIPEIIEEGFAPERLRVQPRRGEEIIVERIPVTPDGKPPYLPSLFSRSEEAAAPPGEPGPSRLVFSVENFSKKVESFSEKSGAPPLLIFDQFEEFVTLFEEAPRTESDVREGLEAQQRILSALVALLRNDRLSIKLLFVFREDYLAKLNKLFVLSPELTDQYLRLTPPRTEALYDIIRGPFEKYAGHFGTELSPELAREVAATFAKRSETGPLVLSEVQVACLRLWQSGNPEALFKQKGVQGLLEDYQADAISRLPEKLRDPAVALLSNMVTSSGTRNVISEDDLISLVSFKEDIPAEKSRAALEVLVNETKLVRRERRRDTPFYEIVSEFLVPWIRQQKIERLAQAERRKKRSLIVVACFFLLLTIGIGGVAWYIYHNRSVAAIAMGYVKTAQAEKEKAEDTAKKALLLKDRAEQTLTQTQQAKVDAEKKYADLNARFTSLQQERDSLKEENKKLIGADLNGKIALLEKERDELKGENKKLSESLSHSWQQAGDVEGKTKTALSSILGTAEALDRRLKTINGRSKTSQKGDQEMNEALNYSNQVQTQLRDLIKKITTLHTLERGY